jgi:hypothetical protein
MSHAFDRDFIKKHHKTGNTEGGKCLTRHISRYRKSSCSHRYQARERALNDDSSWYNTYQADAKKVYKNPPAAGTWHVAHGTNFQKSSWRPYRHNGHHLIPNGVMRDAINAAAEEAKEKGPALRILIRGGLLDAGYNLNHKINMIILPLGVRVAWVIKLPAHLEDHAQSHEAYSAKVETKVNEIIRKYKSTLASAAEAHPEAPNKLAKDALETASGQFRKAIRAWGEARHQLYLDRIPMAHFAKFLE